MADETVTITNELLYFVQNKRDVMHLEMIVKLTSDFYDNEQIEKAKDIVFKLLENERKPRNDHILVQRKRLKMWKICSTFI